MEFALPKDAFRGGHCGVQAVAVVAGISLNDAFVQFKKHCKFIAKRKRWSGGTHYEDRLVVLDKLNVKYDKLLQKVGNKPEWHNSCKIGYGMTLQRFIKDVANPNHVYMVTTTGHVQLVRGGQVLDQGGVKEIAEFRGKRKRITFPVLRIDVAEAAEAFDIAEAQTFGLPLFDHQGDN